MATHDVGQDCGPLRPGMVFTIEPALRVPEERIYIRLEDVIVIGERKADVLTTFVPLDIPGIELLMREEGMLQRYPQGFWCKQSGEQIIFTCTNALLTHHPCLEAATSINQSLSFASDGTSLISSATGI